MQQCLIQMTNNSYQIFSLFLFSFAENSTEMNQTIKQYKYDRTIALCAFLCIMIFNRWIKQKTTLCMCDNNVLENDQNKLISNQYESPSYVPLHPPFLSIDCIELNSSQSILCVFLWSLPISHSIWWLKQ